MVPVIGAVAGRVADKAVEHGLTAASMWQAGQHHSEDVDLQVKAEKTTQKLHLHSIINETRHFVEAFVQAEAMHAQSLRQGKQQHSESMAAARRSEQREGMRDALSNATTRVNTVLVCDTVLLGCAFGLVVEGLPEPWAHCVDSSCSGSASVQESSVWELVDVWDWLLVVYILFLGVAIGCLTISMYCGIIFLDLLTRFQIDDHHTDMTVTELSKFLADGSKGRFRPYDSSSPSGTRIFTKWLGEDDDNDDSCVPRITVQSIICDTRRRPKIWEDCAKGGLESGLVFLFVAAAVLLFIRLIRNFHNGLAALMFVGCCAITVILVMLFRFRNKQDRKASKAEEFAASDKAFKQMDRNKDDRMSTGELHELLKNLQLPFNLAQTQEFLRQFMDTDLADQDEFDTDQSLSRQESVYFDCKTEKQKKQEKQQIKRAFMRQLALVVQQVYNPDTFFSTQAGEEQRVQVERRKMKQMVEEQGAGHAIEKNGVEQLLREFDPDGEYKWMNDSLETARKVEEDARKLLTELVQAGGETLASETDDNDEFLSPVAAQNTEEHEHEQQQESLMPEGEKP